MSNESYITEEDIKTLLDFFVSNKYEYNNLNLTEKEYYELETFVKKHLFIVEDEKEEDSYEYKRRLIFLYKGKLLMIYELKSYSSDLHILLLSKNV